MNRNKLIPPFLILIAIFLFVGIATHIHNKNSVTLDKYAKDHPEAQQSSSSQDGAEEPGAASAENTDTDKTIEDSAENSASSAGNAAAGSAPSDHEQAVAPVSTLTGALLNGGPDGKAMLSERVSYGDTAGTNTVDADAEHFYYEPLSEPLRRYITGVTYPAQSADSGKEPAVTCDDLRYLHLLHYDFSGEIAEGELICNQAIAEDLLDIFYELYRNEYQLEKVLLVDEYGGDDIASMANNNTSCFNYRAVDGKKQLSKHALGVALDINPLYNPYVTYEKDGSEKVSPAEGAAYADRSASFPYKIDENDLCYKLFIQHGFTWGGNWNSSKDYQHFQKLLP